MGRRAAHGHQCAVCRERASQGAAGPNVHAARGALEHWGAKRAV